MAAPKFLQLIGAVVSQVTAAVLGGAGAANQIVATNSSGYIDNSFLNGVGANTQTMVASEALAAGAFVNCYSNAGVLNARNADSSVATKPAHGYVLAAVASSGTATVYFPGGNNTDLSGLTPGTQYYLGSVGAVVVAASVPTAAGSMVQYLGVALSSTTLEFAPQAQVNN